MSNHNPGEQNMSPDRKDGQQQGNFKNDPNRARDGEKKGGENNQSQPKGY